MGGRGAAVRTLASEIQEAALRISGLVLAIKGYTHMDQAAFPSRSTWPRASRTRWRC